MTARGRVLVFVVLGLGTIVVVGPATDGPFPGIYPAFSVVLMACGAGALVEIVGYIGTPVAPNSNVGDHGNDMHDLVANLAGAVAATAVLGVGDRRSRHVATG